MFPEKGGPGVCGKFIIVHAGKGLAPEPVSLIPFENLQKRIRHTSYNRSGIQDYVRRTHRRSEPGVFHGDFRPEEGVLVPSQALHRGSHVDSQDRIVGEHIMLVEDSPGDNLVL